ncbi:transcriptional repressor [Patescibacteria group bacterium]|nr:transcriptional repressor [Patescibacteria group bacterium]
MKSKTINFLKAQGHRITPVRERIIEIFINAEYPLNAKQILDLFKRDKIKVHRATVYREIEFFLSNELIHPVYLGQESISYEINKQEHHHHFVCEKCGKVIDVNPIGVEKELEKFENLFRKEQGIKIKRHALKFFGFCKKCQK